MRCASVRTISKTVFVPLYICSSLFSFPLESQQPKKVPRIGFLVPVSAVLYASRIEAFRQGLICQMTDQSLNFFSHCGFYTSKKKRVLDKGNEPQ